MGDPDEAALRAEFEPILLAERADLLSLSAGSADSRAPVVLDQQSVGRLARMDAMQQQAMASATERRRRSRLSRIEAALKRMDSGDFGFCLGCGEFIGAGRLRIDPTNAACIRCASGG